MVISEIDPHSIVVKSRGTKRSALVARLVKITWFEEVARIITCLRIVHELVSPFQ